MTFLATSTFTLFVTTWRDVLLPPPMAGEEASSGLPPPQTAYGGSYDAGYSAGGAGGGEEGYDGSASGAPAVL